MTTMQEFMNAQPKRIPGLRREVCFYWGGGHFNQCSGRLGREPDPRPDLGYLFRASAEVDIDYGVRINFHVYQILKVTPCGVRIAIGCVRFKPDGTAYQQTRFVLIPSTKQFASKTAEEAIDQLRYRNAKYIKILRSRLDDANDACAALEGYRNHAYDPVEPVEERSLTRRANPPEWPL